MSDNQTTIWLEEKHEQFLQARGEGNYQEINNILDTLAEFGFTKETTELWDMLDEREKRIIIKQLQTEDDWMEGKEERERYLRQQNEHYGEQRN